MAEAKPEIRRTARRILESVLHVDGTRLILQRMGDEIQVFRQGTLPEEIIKARTIMAALRAFDQSINKKENENDGKDATGQA